MKQRSEARLKREQESAQLLNKYDAANALNALPDQTIVPAIDSKAHQQRRYANVFSSLCCFYLYAH
jgi:1,6-anhydro-N-acetylmuramate kinase